MANHDDLYDAARGWLTDAGHAETADDLADDEIRARVDQRYPGGWAGLVADLQDGGE